MLQVHSGSRCAPASLAANGIGVVAFERFRPLFKAEKNSLKKLHESLRRLERDRLHQWSLVEGLQPTSNLVVGRIVRLSVPAEAAAAPGSPLFSLYTRDAVHTWTAYDTFLEMSWLLWKLAGRPVSVFGLDRLNTAQLATWLRFFVVRALCIAQNLGRRVIRQRSEPTKRDRQLMAAIYERYRSSEICFGEVDQSIENPPLEDLLSRQEYDSLFAQPDAHAHTSARRAHTKAKHSKPVHPDLG